MQIMIDLTVANDPATLRRIASLLSDVAANSGPAELTPAAPAVPVVIPAPPAAPAPAPVIPPPPTMVAGEGSTVVVIPPPPVIPPPANVQLDKSGLPWDERIHSETPTINKSDGLWRMKRGIGDKRELVEAVEAELRANYPAPSTAPPAPVIPPPPSVTLPPPVIPPPPAVVAAPNAPAPTVMVPPPPPVTAGVSASDGQGSVDAFRALMKRVDGHTGPEGRLRREIMVPIYEELGLKSLTDFHKHRDKIPALLQKIDALLA